MAATPESLVGLRLADAEGRLAGTKFVVVPAVAPRSTVRVRTDRTADGQDPDWRVIRVRDEAGCILLDVTPACPAALPEDRHKAAGRSARGDG